MLFGQLSLGRADAPSYRNKGGTKRATRPEQNNLEGHSVLILELSLRRNKGQPAVTVMRSISLHLETPKDHPRTLTDMCERH